MSAKYLYEENPDLHKQTGCMYGMFQLLDRHHFLGGRRYHHHKKLTAGQNGNDGIEFRHATTKITGKHQKPSKEKPKGPSDTPRTSLSSSSCSSSLSPTDCNRTSQAEPRSFKQTNVPQTTIWDSPKPQPNASLPLSRQSLNLHYVVKDSIYREPRGLSVKTSAKGEAGRQTLKYIDSPRPSQPSKSVKPKVSGLNEPLRAFAKLQEAPWSYNERKDGSLTPAPRDAPRFSYDGRESRDGFKSTIKLRELPRLSLDSRASSLRGSTTEMKSSCLQWEPGSYKGPSSVVAKLMGLEALPDSMLINGNQRGQMKTYPDVECYPSLSSSRTPNENKQQRVSGSQVTYHREPTSPRLRNADPAKKPMASSKFPIEPAPWKQSDGSKGSQASVLKCRENPSKVLNSSLSVYGEIEKSLAELEFKKSGKDLRALKQILEAMQKTKEMLESRKESQASNLASRTSSLDQSSKLANPRKLLNDSPISGTIKSTTLAKCSKSPIVIMKPAKLIDKASNPLSSTIPPDKFAGLHGHRTGDSTNGRKESVEKRTDKDLNTITKNVRNPSSPFHPIDKNTVARTSKLPQTPRTSKEPRPIITESTTTDKRTGSVSLRLQQKKLVLEKQSRPTTPSSDSSRDTRQSSRMPIESNSPRRKPRPKPSILQQSSDESENGSNTRDFNHQSDAVSLQSESNISMASLADTEVSSTDGSDRINNSFFQQQGLKQKSPAAKLTEDRSMVEPAVTLEQPSPVSVLDAFYSDEVPSPIKKISHAFRDDEALNFNEAEWNPMDVNCLPSCTKINHEKVESIQKLLQNLTQMTSVREEPIVTEIAPLYDSTKPNHRYIVEILLASGLLKNLETGFTTIRLHRSGHLLDPDLFFALEQTKERTGLLDEHSHERISCSKPNAKIQRKLLFDVVNEILVHKLELETYTRQWLSPNKLGGKRPQGDQLLRELLTDVDRMRANSSNCSIDDEDNGSKSILRADLMHQPMDWTGGHSELSGLVLDVERLIFKDLISEVVNGEAGSLWERHARHCRRLFSC